VYYGTDGMYHDWYLKFRVLSASQGMVTLSLYTIRGVNCVSLQFGSFMSIYTIQGSKKLSSHRSSVSRHASIDYFY